MKNEDACGFLKDAFFRLSRRVAFAILPRSFAMLLENRVVSGLQDKSPVSQSRLFRGELNQKHMRRLVANGFLQTAFEHLFFFRASNPKITDLVWATDFLISNTSEKHAEIIWGLWSELPPLRVSKLSAKAISSAVLFSAKYNLELPEIFIKANSTYARHREVAPALWNASRNQKEFGKNPIQINSLFENLYLDSKLRVPFVREAPDFSFSKLCSGLNDFFSRKDLPIRSSNPVISVIVAFRNEELHLANALKSIQNQTLDEIEVLMVDDGSNDSSGDIASGFEKTDPRFRYFRRETGSGTYACRNLALQKAKGDAITFHDADDWSHPQKLEKQFKSLNQGSMAVLGTRYRITKDLEFCHRDSLSKLVGSDMSSLMFWRLPVAREIGAFYEVKAGSDSEFFRRLQTHFGPSMVTVLDKYPPMTLQLARDESLTRRGVTSFVGKNFGFRNEFHRFATKRNFRMARGKSSRVDDGLTAAQDFFASSSYSFSSGDELTARIVLVADLSRSSEFLKSNPGLVGALNKKVDPLHVFHSPLPWTVNRGLDDEISELIHKRRLVLVAPGENLTAEQIIIDPGSIGYLHEGLENFQTLEVTRTTQDCLDLEKFLIEEVDSLRDSQASLKEQGLEVRPLFQVLSDTKVSN